MKAEWLVSSDEVADHADAFLKWAEARKITPEQLVILMQIIGDEMSKNLGMKINSISKLQLEDA